MPTLTLEEQQQLVDEFINAHKDEFEPKLLADYIRSHVSFLKTVKDAYHVSAELRQVYSEVGILEDRLNIYLGFLKVLEEEHDISDRHIVEVGGGYVPSLAKTIALRQKTGTITVYDPRVINTGTYPANLILKRQSFSKDTQIPHANMIIGFMPCEATPAIIESACRNNIDFMVGLCEGGTRGGYGYIEYDDEWIGLCKYIAERGMAGTDMGELKEVSLAEYGSPYPIIYNKRKNS